MKYIFKTWCKQLISMIIVIVYQHYIDSNEIEFKFFSKVSSSNVNLE